ncbi:putative ribonuclease H-like domain-containing protein [Tanacetum coccineum]
MIQLFTTLVTLLRECQQRGTHDGRRRRGPLYQHQEDGKQEKNQMGLLIMDDGIVNWEEHTKVEETNHALMAISSSSEGPQEPEPNVSDDRSSEYSTCQSNDSEDLLELPLNIFLSHLIKDCDYYEKKMAREAEFKKQRVFNTGNGVAKPVWTNANRVNHANQFVPRSVQLNTGRTNINSVRPNINTGRTNVNPVRPRVNTGSSNELDNAKGPQGGPQAEKAWVPQRKLIFSFSCAVSSLKNMEVSGILQNFIRQIENQLSHRVKIIRSDNGTEFKNRDMLEFCGNKGIKQEYSNARTPQQNRVAERMNRTLIEAARTMLADSLLPTTFWQIVVYTLSVLGKFDGKSDEGFLVGYSLTAKTYRVLIRTHIPVSLEISNPHAGAPEGKVSENTPTSTPSVNTGSDSVNTGGFDPDDSPMPELENLSQFKLQQVWVLVDLPHGMKVIGTKWVYRNKRDEKGVLSKIRKIGGQGFSRKKGLDYDEDKYVAEILKKFDLVNVKTAITPMETKVALTKDEEAIDVDVTPKTSHLNLEENLIVHKGKPKFRLLVSKRLPFDLEAFSDSDYGGSNLDRKSATVQVTTFYYYFRFMAQLKYCDKHNQVGFLRKPDESAGFAEIVDFLRGSNLRYALTSNPTIYDSIVKQFWQTATAKTLADGTLELHATIDTIVYTITEASIRNKLQLADASGITMLPNNEIFERMGNMGYPTDGSFTFWKSFFTPQWRFLVDCSFTYL